MRYLVNFSYDGSCFFGLAKQKDKKTVQSQIEKLLSKRFDTDIKTIVSSRTDKGVHSFDSYLHFDAKKVDINNLISFLNKSLNGEIFIRRIDYVNNDFHCRYSVLEKTYLYIINIDEFKPIEKNYILQYCKEINIKKVKKASKYLIGEHNFKMFTPSNNLQKSYIRKINKIDIYTKNNYVYFSITGSGFLQYMVRNIVRLLLEINEDKKSIEQLKNIFNTKTSYNNPIDACGLYLYKTIY